MAEFLGWTDEEIRRIQDEFEERRRPGKRVREICVCGHAVARHKMLIDGSKFVCAPGRMKCPCRKPVPVLRVSDSRAFMAKTRGTGKDHALVRGYANALSMAEKIGHDLKVEWIVEPYCQWCAHVKGEDAELVTEGVQPVALSASGFVSSEPSATNVFLCERCAKEKLRWG